MSARPRLGEVLVDSGALTNADLRAALREQQRTGDRLGRILLGHHVVTRLQLFKALSTVWDLPFVDLKVEPPDVGLLDEVGVDILLTGRWVPLSRVSSTARVAVSELPDEETHTQMCELLNVDTLDLAVTTDWDVEEVVIDHFGDILVDRAALELADTRPELSAEEPAAVWQKVAALGVPIAVLVGVVVNWQATVSTLLVLLNVLFATAVASKLFISVVGATRRTKERPPALDEDDLPTVTVLVPVYHEAAVVAKVVDGISALDYPSSKLQVLVLLEEGDDETILAAKKAAPPPFVRLVVVPRGGPQTKPKACNVGLALATGEYLVIYDAEDRPEPGQLREMAAAFAAADGHVVCQQARLNYYNTYQNFLTRMFTLEYSVWFDFLLPGLDALKLPIPLGGTSNHFRTRALRALGGWDPYNVTEDADLGLRVSALGGDVGVIDSTTWEEACSETRAWVRQRTRWIKGYIITAMVHLRQPSTAASRLGWRGVAGLLMVVVGTPALFLAAPLVWAFWLYTFLGGVVPNFFLPTWVAWVSLAVLVVGNVSMVVLGMIAAQRRNMRDLIGFAVLNPIYWGLHSFAAWRALFQVITSPAVWEKTPHAIQHGPAGHAHDDLAVSVPVTD